MVTIRAFENGWAESEWNPANFEGVILQYQPRIYNFIYGLVQEKHLAQDLTQDTFLQAYRALGKEVDNAKQVVIETNQYQPESELCMLAWLYKIARNTAFSELRRRKRMQFSSFWPCDANGIEYEVDALDRTGLEGYDSDLENHYVLREELERAIATVGRSRLTALLLHLDGYSYKEISRLTSTSFSSVRSQIFRAKKDLRRTFLSQPDLRLPQLSA